MYNGSFVVPRVYVFFLIKHSSNVRLCWRMFKLYFSFVTSACISFCVFFSIYVFGTVRIGRQSWSVLQIKYGFIERSFGAKLLLHLRYLRSWVSMHRDHTKNYRVNWVHGKYFMNRRMMVTIRNFCSFLHRVQN